jgi:hypothetical protein
MTYYKKKLVLNEWARWINTMPGDQLAVTLTFLSRYNGEYLTDAIGRDTINLFAMRLNQIAYGRQSRPRGGKPGRKTGFVAVKEGSTVASSDHHLHYHLIIATPPGHTHESWADICEREWHALNWGSKKQNRFITQRDKRWTGYILKMRTKIDETDCVDLDSFCIETSEA